MSRSYKKNAILKDGGNGYKKLAHHKARAAVRNALNSKLEYDELLFPTTKAKELVNQYDICDYKYGPYYWGEYSVTKKQLIKYRMK